MFTISVLCHNYQHRLTWMISSLLLQVKTSEPITMDIAYLKDTGTPTTYDVIDFFERFPDHSKKVKFVHHEYNETTLHTFNHRGLIRNDQLRDCKTDWQLFADTDMVYHPQFFYNLQVELEKHKEAEYMLTAGRLSGERQKFDKLVSRVDTYPCVVPSAFDFAMPFAKRTMRNVGAGFFQLVNNKYTQHGGLYVHPESCRDWNMQKKGLNPKSDMQFRKRVGSTVKLPEWFSQNQIHLNHRRDPDAKQHITEQR